MISASDIEALRTVSDDYQLTEELKGKLTHLKKERKPFYIEVGEFEEILRWKLRTQYGRQLKWRSVNTDEIIRSVTKLAFSISSEDKEYELELRFGILCSLRGVGVPVASAMLALVFPEEYCVIDFRGWRQVFGEVKQPDSVAQYKRYLHEVRNLAMKLGWPVQEVDLAIWEFDIRQNG